MNPLLLWRVSLHDPSLEPQDRSRTRWQEDGGLHVSLVRLRSLEGDERLRGRASWRSCASARTDSQSCVCLFACSFICVGAVGAPLSYTFFARPIRLAQKVNFWSGGFLQRPLSSRHPRAVFRSDN